MLSHFKKAIVPLMLLTLLVIAPLLNIIPAHAQALPRDQTLYVVADVGGAYVGAFNPWGTADRGTYGLLYLPLFYYDAINDNFIPVLAKSVELVSPYEMIIRLRDEARWSDGTPITADDVIFTNYLVTQVLYYGPPACWGFSLEKIDNKTIRAVKSVGWSLYEAATPQTIIDDVKKLPNVVNITQQGNSYIVTFNVTWSNTYDYLGCLQMIPFPAHIIKPIFEQGGTDALRQWRNDNPVYSGPWRVKEVSASYIIYERDDNWWGKDIFGLPKPKYIALIAYRDNPTANLALQTGDVDWGAMYIPRVWEMFSYGVGTWFKHHPYYLDDGIGPLYINVAKPPLNNSLVRKAIAYAIPYKEIISRVWMNYTKQMSAIFANDLFPQGAKYVNAIKDICVTYWGTEDCRIPTDLDKAKQLLDQAGIIDKNGDGWRDLPDGTPFKLTCSVPYGWTDNMMACTMIVENLRKIGINAETYFPDYSTWWGLISQGAYDLVMGWDGGTDFANPFANLAGMFFNWYGFSAAVSNAMQNYVTTPLLWGMLYYVDENVKIQFLRVFAKLYFETMYVIPLWYGTHWYEYNTKYWVGFPDETNPYFFPAAPWAWPGGPLFIIPFAIAKAGETPTLPAWLRPENRLSRADLWSKVVKAYLGIAQTTTAPATTTTITSPSPTTSPTTTTAPATTTLTTTITPQTITTTATITITQTITVTSPTTVQVSSVTSVTTTVTQTVTEWTTPIVLGVVLLVIGFIVGYLIKRK